MGDPSPSAAGTPIVNIVAERVALGPLHEGLIPFFVRWENDFATIEAGGDMPTPRSPQMVAATWEPLIRGQRADWIGFAIYELPHLDPIGHTNLRDYLSPDRTAEFGITIGEVTRRGQGLGTEATKLMLDYAFSVLGVHNVWLDTLVTNEGARRAYTRAGFKEIGRRREARRLGDRMVDLLLMDCLATEFVPPRRRAVPRP